MTRVMKTLPHPRALAKPFGVQGLIPGEGLQTGAGVLSRKVSERLYSLKELVGRQVEREDRIERAGRAQVSDSSKDAPPAFPVARHPLKKPGVRMNAAVTLGNVACRG